MPAIDVVVESKTSRSIRARQLESIFDVPPMQKTRLEWKGDLPIEEDDWNVGLIVGPSGCGKSTIARSLWGRRVSAKLKWTAPAVVDDFAASLKIDDISRVCQAVGFNTIPAWLRPHKVLSTGEQFRVDLARRLLEQTDPIIVDEFTSVVDRQVAKIGAHAVQKYVRRKKRKFVAVSCHYDIVKWLQPDWVFEPATMAFARRRVRRRPKLNGFVSRVDHGTWDIFAPYHYMSAKLHKGARCFALYVEGQLAAFAGMLRRPHPKVKNIMGCSRLVTLPDWQGLGLAFILIEAVAAAYKARGELVHTYPAHPALIRGFDRSPSWALRKKPGTFSPVLGVTTSIGTGMNKRGFGGRPCAVFRYEGPASDSATASLVLGT